MRLLLVAAVVLIAACGEQTADRQPAAAAPTISEQADTVNQMARESAARPGETGADPMMEAECKDVSADAMRAAEDKMKQSSAGGEFVVMDAADMQALNCSRYRQRLGAR